MSRFDQQLRVLLSPSVNLGNYNETASTREPKVRLNNSRGILPRNWVPKGSPLMQSPQALSTRSCLPLVNQRHKLTHSSTWRPSIVSANPKISPRSYFSWQAMKLIGSQDKRCVRMVGSSKHSSQTSQHNHSLRSFVTYLPKNRTVHVREHTTEARNLCATNQAKSY